MKKFIILWALLLIFHATGLVKLVAQIDTVRFKPREAQDKIEIYDDGVRVRPFNEWIWIGVLGNGPTTTACAIPGNLPPEIPEDVVQTLALCCGSMKLITPSIKKTYKPGVQINFSWTKYKTKFYQGVDADKYTYKVKYLGLQTVYANENVHSGTIDPALNFNWTPPCDKPGFYTVTVNAYEKRLNKFILKCSITSAFVVQAAPIPPTPIAQIACEPGVYKLVIPNPQNNEQLKLYESANTATSFQTVTQKDSKGNFIYNVNIQNESKVFFMSFYNPNQTCELFQETLRVPVGVMYIDMGLLLSQDLGTVEIKKMDGTCTTPGTYYDLGSDFGAMQDLISDEIDDINMQLGDGTVDYARAKVKFLWKDAAYTTAYTVVPGVNGQKVCFTGPQSNPNLPDYPGSCRNYTMDAEITFSLGLNDVNGDRVIEQEGKCTKSGLKKVQVCKEIPAPPHSMLITCAEGVPFIEVPANGFASAEWINLEGDKVAVGFKNYNSGRNGFSYTDYTTQPEHVNDYSLRVYYVAQNGRKSKTFGGYQVVPLPGPMDLNQNHEVDQGEKPVMRPTVNDPNSPLYCTEPGTYYDLDYNADDYINGLEDFIETLPEVNNYVGFNIPKIKLTWSPSQNIYKYNTANNGYIDRVCYDNLPPANESYRDYYGNVNIEGDGYLIIAGDTIGKEQIICNPLLFKVRVKKAPEIETIGGQCFNETSPEDANQALFLTNCDSIAYKQLCPNNYAVELGANPMPIPLNSYSYSWDRTEGFISGNATSQKATISYTSAGMGVGTYRVYKQLVNASIRDEFSYRHCEVVYKCANCTDGSAKKGNQEEAFPRMMTSSVSQQVPVFKVYPIPSIDILNVEIEGELNEGNILIRDLLGRTVERMELRQINNSVITISTNNLMPGNYFLTVLKANGLNTTKSIQIVR